MDDAMTRTLIVLSALLGFVCQAVAQTGYPPGSIPITASATGTTGAIAATIPALANKTAYLCGFYYTGTNATAANTTTAVTVTGVVGGTMTYGFPTLAAAATTPNTIPIDDTFLPCIAATSVNTAIVVNGPALGAGATQTTATAWGYYQ
jgi:hypothetical protein